MRGQFRIIAGMNGAYTVTDGQPEDGRCESGLCDRVADRQKAACGRLAGGAARGAGGSCGSCAQPVFDVHDLRRGRQKQAPVNFFALWAKKVPRLPRNRRRSLPLPTPLLRLTCNDFDGGPMLRRCCWCGQPPLWHSPLAIICDGHVPRPDQSRRQAAEKRKTVNRNSRLHVYNGRSMSCTRGFPYRPTRS